MLTIVLMATFPILMAYAAASDLFTMTIPNRLSILLVVAFACVALTSGLPGEAVLRHVAAGALVLTVCFGMFAAGWIGGGDAKLAAATALWFGFGDLVDYLSIAAIAGGVLTLIILAVRAVPLPAFALRWNWLDRLHDQRNGVPYGIALAAAALLLYPQSAVFRAAISG